MGAITAIRAVIAAEEEKRRTGHFLNPEELLLRQAFCDNATKSKHGARRGKNLKQAQAHFEQLVMVKCCYGGDGGAEQVALALVNSPDSGQKPEEGKTMYTYGQTRDGCDVRAACGYITAEGKKNAVVSRENEKNAAAALLHLIG